MECGWRVPHISLVFREMWGTRPSSEKPASLPFAAIPFSMEVLSNDRNE